MSNRAQKRDEERDFEAKGFVTSSLAKVGNSESTRHKDTAGQIMEHFNFKSTRHVRNRALR